MSGNRESDGANEVSAGATPSIDLGGWFGVGHRAGRRGRPAGPTSDPARNGRADTERGGDADPEPTPDEVFTLLRNDRRRAVLRRLRAVPETTLSDLTDCVAASEADTTRERLRSRDRKRVYISLYQSHLPQLADAGIVAYDRNRGTVRRLPAADRLDRQLNRFRAYTTAEETTGWYRLAGVGAGLAVILGAVGVSPLGGVSPEWVAAVAVVALCTLAAVRSGSERSYDRS